MCSFSGETRRAITAVKRTLMILVLFAAVFICLELSVFAEDSTLTIKKDGEVITTFSQDELEQIALDEGDKVYQFSTWNNHPSFKMYSNVKGPTVSGVLEKAGIRDEISDTSIITFTDGVYKASLTGYQLFNEPRYCFPNGELANPTSGMAIPESYTDKSALEAVIYLIGGEEERGLCVGQTAPNDENRPAFVWYLNSIEVNSGPVAKCKLPTPEPPNKSKCKKGQDIVLNGAGKSLEYIYYTLDGSEPDYGSQIYNSGVQSGTETRPVLPNKSGVYQLKVKVKGYGKQDSDVACFEYTVLDEPSKPTIKLTAGKKKITVKWKKITGANGYVVYRSTKKASGYKAIKTIKKGSTVSFTNKNLKKGNRYYYKVRAYKNAYDTKVFSKYSSVKSTKAK